MQISKNDALWVSAAGIIGGTGAAVLTFTGNPVDGGLSIACFLRDAAGSLGLHQLIEFSYIRPEIAGIAIGAFISACLSKEYKPKGGASGLLRFFIGMVISFGVFAFVGCPMRLCLRMAGGDPASIIGLMGLIAGVWTGTLFLKNGFSLGKHQPAGKGSGISALLIIIAMLVLLFAKPAFINLSSQRHAPVLLSLLISIILGVAAQRSRLCFIGGIRNFFLIKDITLLAGFFAFILSAFIVNICLNQLHWGIHIVGSADPIWSFLSVFTVGMGSTLLGGCPFRQLILASQGDSDSILSLMGIIAGAAISYNMYFAYIGGGFEIAGKIAILVSIAFLFIVARLETKK